MQDVGFALQRSRHLDISQKGEYAAQIDHTITRISGDHEQLPLRPPIKLDSQIEKVASAIRHDDKDQALSLLETIKGEFVEAGSVSTHLEPLEPPSHVLVERKQENLSQLLLSLMAGLAVVFSVFLERLS